MKDSTKRSVAAYNKIATPQIFHSIGIQVYFTIKNGKNNLKGQKLDVAKDRFYIDKTTLKRYRRESDIPTGHKSREITYLVDKDTRDLLGKVSRVVEKGIFEANPNWANDLHGFLHNKNCMTNMLDIKAKANTKELAKAYMKMDLSSAFNSVPEEFVFHFFYKTLDLNLSDAQAMTKCCCDETRHLYQGCPISPLLFAIYSYGMVQDFKGAGFQVSAYADDMTIIGEYEAMSNKTRKFANKIASEYGFKMNIDKTKFGRTNSNDVICGFHTNSKKVKRHRKLMKKIRVIKYIENNFDRLVSLNKMPSKRMNKKGKQIELTQEHYTSVRKGYEAWETCGLKICPITLALSDMKNRACQFAVV